jgi:hypothetical protein
MCWQDVQISRQTTRERNESADAGSNLSWQLKANIRRVRVIATAMSVDPAGPGAILQIFAGPLATNAANRIVAHTVREPFVFDIDQYGFDVGGPITIEYTGDAISSDITLVSYELTDTLGLGEPITQKV